MVLAYAGRLPGAADFPADNVAYVREQVERLLKNLRPRVVVGSGAAGADLLTAEAALKSGAEVKLVLAGSVAEFRDSSVAGRGADWERLFDTLSIDGRVEVVEVARHEDDADSYRATTGAIRSAAVAVCEGDEPVVGLSVSERRAGEDHTADLADALELHGGLVLRIDPARRREATPRAFVAMPFGRRHDAEHGWTDYDADLTYERIILPALIDAGYRPIRADAEAVLEMIDLTMLRAIHAADVLVADLATLNANVMWEVGVRHAWRRAGTILLRPVEVRPPFDVSHARVHAYRRDEMEVSDADAVAGIELLRGLLDAVAERRVDSPVFLTLPGLVEPRLEPDAAGEAPEGRRYMEDVSLAADLWDTDGLRRLARAVSEEAALGEAARGQLLEQIGLALVAAGCHTAAAAVLAPLAERDVALEHVRLQQQYAHALIRSDEAAGREGRIADAERRLRALASRHPPSGETYGLLGSAAKARVEQALATGCDPGVQLDVAIDAYLEGFRLDPSDYYPGVVALALLRLRGQRIAPNAEDVEAARELLPIVRFAATRLGEPSDQDVWRLATVAELALHDYLLHDDGHDDALVQATARYARVAAVGRPEHWASVARQLRLLRNAGDPEDVIGALLALFDVAPSV